MRVHRWCTSMASSSLPSHRDLSLGNSVINCETSYSTQSVLVLWAQCMCVNEAGSGAWLSELSAFLSRWKWYRQRHPGIGKQATSKNPLWKPKVLDLRAFSGCLSGWVTLEEKAFPDCKVVAGTWSSDFIHERGCGQESSPVGFGILSGVFLRVLWVIESHLWPQRWVSVKDPWVLDLTVSHHSWTHRGCLERSGSMKKEFQCRTVFSHLCEAPYKCKLGGDSVSETIYGYGKPEIDVH